MRRLYTILLITTLLTSCGLVKPKYRYTYENIVIPKRTSIEKLDECTERYISTLGVKPKESLEICVKIHRRE